MFTSIRVKLTALYIAAMLIFLTLISAIVLVLIQYYFQSTTDLGLHHKMAHEYELLNLPMPPELSNADAQWNLLKARILSFNTLMYQNNSPYSTPTLTTTEHSRNISDIPLEEAYDVELASIYSLILDERGTSIQTHTQTTLPQPNGDGVKAARIDGYNLRTSITEQGSRVRLLTYQLPKNGHAAFAQVGRLLTDQDAILNQLLGGMLLAGGVIALLSSVGCWWLAGRSLRPVAQAWQRQQTFVANASHELKTPLALIHLSSELAIDPKTPQTEQVELAQGILRETRYMTHLISDLLLLSRLDAGQLQMNLQQIALLPWLDELCDSFESIAAQKQVTVTLHCDVNLKALVDPTRLRQTLLILLDNGLKHTQPGGALRISATSSQKQLTIQIADTGEGIASEHLPHLFDRFYQVDAAHSTQGNAGLGLSIAKSLIEAMHARIDIQSVLGKGTTVSLIFPHDRVKSVPTRPLHQT